ncbi:MAG: hypothetical protein Ct9H90mP4_00360 [Gammaproteobacteria bacterium]|nr:MAG: hypothetical protein Ct9H90mP4_00360 [Gammaproteobacteria bacterium]
MGNPANTNALIGMTKAQNPSQQWLAMTAFDANRAKAQLAIKAGKKHKRSNQYGHLGQS